jgi:uncharacterized protein YegL
MSASSDFSFARQVLPFYLVCDESGSMDGAPIRAINDALPELHQEIGSNPVVADKTQFCIIGFSDDAEVLLELSDLSQVMGLPVLKTRGGTSYAAAFRVLKQTMERDIAQLKSAGHKVYRPVVFFLTDGYPTDANWEKEYRALVDPGLSWHPNILAFGIGEADANTISAIATFKAFIADNTIGPADALKEFATALTKSIVRSGSTATEEGMKLQAPDEVPGFTSLTVDAI